MSTNHPTRAQQLDARELAAAEDISYTAALRTVRSTHASQESSTASSEPDSPSDEAAAHAGCLAFPAEGTAAHREWQDLFRAGTVRLGRWLSPVPTQGAYVDQNLDTPALFVGPPHAGRHLAATYAVGAAENPDLYEAYYVDATGKSAVPNGVTYIGPDQIGISFESRLDELIDHLLDVVIARRKQRIQKDANSLYEDEGRSAGPGLPTALLERPKRIVLILDGYDSLPLGRSSMGALLNMLEDQDVGFQTVITTSEIPGDTLTYQLDRRRSLMGFVGPQELVAKNGIDLSHHIPASTPACRVHVPDHAGDRLFPFQAYAHCS